MSEPSREGCPETSLSPWRPQAGTSAEPARSRRRGGVLDVLAWEEDQQPKSFKALTAFSDTERPRVSVQGPSHGATSDAWSGALLHCRAGQAYRPCSLGRRAVSPGNSSAQPNGWAPCGTPTPCSVNRYFWKGSKESHWRQWASVGVFCKLEALSIHGKEEVSSLFVAKLLAPPPGRASEPTTTSVETRTEGSL